MRWLKAGIGLIFLVVALVAVGFDFIWSIDPARRITKLQGTVMSSGASQAPNNVIRYYKMNLLVQIDDGRRVGVLSERRSAPSIGERVTVQERIGWLGTARFVEIPQL